MRLYQFAFGHQPHYVVARDYGAAEALIKKAGYSTPQTITDLGPYVLLPALDELTELGD